MTTDNYYIINLKNFEIVKSTKVLSKDLIGQFSYLNGYVYIFGGWSQGAYTNSCGNTIWNLINCETIENLPCNSGYGTTCRYEEDILYAGYHTDSIFKYSILQNSYQKIPGIPASTYKMLFSFCGNIYLIETSKLYMSSDGQASKFWIANPATGLTLPAEIISPTVYCKDASILF